MRLVAPGTLDPFLTHWYVGADPPPEVVAVKVTEEPAQEGLFEAEILAATVTIGFTFMVSGLESAGLPDGQVAFEVTWHLTISWLAGV